MAPGEKKLTQGLLAVAMGGILFSPAPPITLSKADPGKKMVPSLGREVPAVAGMTLRSLDTPATLTGGSIIIDDPFDLVMGSLLIPAEMVDGHFPGNPTIFGPVLSTFKKRK